MSAYKISAVVISVSLSIWTISMGNDRDPVVEQLERTAGYDFKLHSVDLTIVLNSLGTKASDIIRHLEKHGFVSDLTVLPGQKAVECEGLVLPVGGDGAMLDRPASPLNDWIRVFVVVEVDCSASSLMVGRTEL